MTDSPQTFVLFNPAAGRGRTADRIREYRDLLSAHLGQFSEGVSEHAGHEVQLIDAALQRGCTRIVAVGGDGTWSIAADRILKAAKPDVALGLLPAGTGNDFGKSLGIRYDTREAVVTGIAAGHTRLVDAGRVAGRYFLNVVGLGFDIAVIDDAATFPLLKGDLLYQFCALRQLFRYRGLPIGVSPEATDAEATPHLMLVIANGNYFGGSFHIAPSARLDDGQLDAVSIMDVGPLARARLFGRVAKGRHEDDPHVVIRQAAGFRLTLPHGLRYEVDGEVYDSGGAELNVSSVPRALRVSVPVD